VTASLYVMVAVAMYLTVSSIRLYRYLKEGSGEADRDELFGVIMGGALACALWPATFVAALVVFFWTNLEASNGIFPNSKFGFFFLTGDNKKRAIACYTKASEEAERRREEWKSEVMAMRLTTKNEEGYL